VVERLKKAKNNGVMYALVSNIGQISLVKELGLTPVGDFRMNITNRESRLFYEEMGLSRFLLSPELTLPRARDVGGGVITYGRIPLMITELCFISRSFGCEKCNNAHLTDRKGEKFPIIREAEHRNLILNSLPTYMGDRQGELLDLGLQSFHLIFTTESGAEIAEILRAHSQRRPLDSKVRRTGRR
jgi:putative protease